MPQARPASASRPRRSGSRWNRTPHRTVAGRAGPCIPRRTAVSSAAATNFRCRRESAERAHLYSFWSQPFANREGTLPACVGRAKYFRYPVGNAAPHSSWDQTGISRMLYAILCYHDEDFVGSWTKEQDAAVVKKLAVVQDKLREQGRLGPVARLLPTTSATTLRKDDPPVVLDGPYAETKEQLLGFYLVDCGNLDEAVDVARDLGAANPGGAYEIRPVGLFQPGGEPK